MKSFKEFRVALDEVAKPKSQAQKHFHAAHKVGKKDHVGYPEHQFKATHGKDKSKHASYHDGEDVKAYKEHQPGDTPSSINRKGAKSVGGDDEEEEAAVRIHEAVSVGGIFSTNPVRSRKAVGKLRNMMKEPIPAGKATDMLHDIAFDSKLFDQIKSFAAQDETLDVRPVIKKRMRELQIKGLGF